MVSFVGAPGPLPRLVRAGGRLLAREVQGHGAQPSGEEARMAEAEGVPPEAGDQPGRAEAGPGGLDLGRLRLAAGRSDPVRLEAAPGGASQPRAASRACPARDRAGPQRERGQSGRAPQADGQGRRRGSSASSTRPGKRPRRPPTSSSSRPRARPSWPSSGPSATSARLATRPWPRSGKRPPTWPSRSPARCCPRN